MTNYPCTFCIIMARSSSRSMQIERRLLYSPADQKKMFMFYYRSKDAGYSPMSNSLWKLGERLKITKHSWQSMKNHFKRVIYPRYEQFKRICFAEIQELEKKEGLYIDMKMNKTDNRLDIKVEDKEFESEECLDSVRNKCHDIESVLQILPREIYRNRIKIIPESSEAKETLNYPSEREELIVLMKMLPSLDLSIIKWAKNLCIRYNIEYEVVLTKLREVGGFPQLAEELMNNSSQSLDVL